MVAEGTFVISAMSAAQLDEAIVSAGRPAGVAYDEGVVAQLVADSLAQPGSLPLLQFTLAELYDRRVDGRIGPDALDAVGGVTGALGRRAERVLRVARRPDEAALASCSPGSSCRATADRTPGAAPD